MALAVGIDPGTVSIDVCGIEDGRLALDLSWLTADAIADPEGFIAGVRSAGEPALVAGPSGYGLPLRPAADVGERELRLAFLAAPEEPGGIGGLRGLARQLAAAGLPVVYTPGLVHLASVPEHRKLNRVDLGTADKLCAAVLALEMESRRLGVPAAAISFILVELGGAFSAAVAVEEGRIVDGVGGTAGPIGWRAAGALDGEVAFLAGSITKDRLFQGGVTTIAAADPGRKAVAVEALVEGAAKMVRQLAGSAPGARTVLLSGRTAADPEVAPRLHAALAELGDVRRLTGFAQVAKEGAQGAALLADGLLGGRAAPLVERLGIREANGSVLDHLHVVSRAEALRRLALDDDG